MDILNNILETAREISRLRSAEDSLVSAKKVLAEIETLKKQDEDLLELLFPVLMEEEYSSMLLKMEQQVAKGHWNHRVIESAKAFIARPKAIGHTVLCTSDDPGADSAANDSQYGLFILVDDGRVVPVVPLGVYHGTFRDEPPLMKEVATRKLPRIEPREIKEKAPQCFEEARKASDTRYHEF